MKYKGYEISRKMRRMSQIMWCAKVDGVWKWDKSTRAELERWIDAG